jgi:hypothetical protein
MGKKVEDGSWADRRRPKQSRYQKPEERRLAEFRYCRRTRPSSCTRALHRISSNHIIRGYVNPNTIQLPTHQSPRSFDGTVLSPLFFIKTASPSSHPPHPSTHRNLPRRHHRLLLHASLTPARPTIRTDPRGSLPPTAPPRWRCQPPWAL